MEAPQHEVKELDITEIKPWSENPRKISPKKVRQLKKSIEKFGFVDPIVVNKRTGMTIVSGHQRHRAASELGFTKVPCIVIDVSPEEEKVMNLAMNNIKGENDKEKLQVVVRDILQFDNLDLELTGFDMSEMAALAGEKEEEVEDPEYPITPYFSEKYNYVVIMTKNEVDWTYLRNALGIETVKSYKSTAVGTGKVIDFEQFEKRWNDR